MDPMIFRRPWPASEVPPVNREAMRDRSTYDGRNTKLEDTLSASVRPRAWAVIRGVLLSRLRLAIPHLQAGHPVPLTRRRHTATATALVSSQPGFRMLQPLNYSVSHIRLSGVRATSLTTVGRLPIPAIGRSASGGTWAPTEAVLGQREECATLLGSASGRRAVAFCIMVVESTSPIRKRPASTCNRIFFRLFGQELP
jgi:hypothetical protein